MCAPTRAALLSGRNSHQVGFGRIPELAAGYPGYNSVWPKNAAGTLGTPATERVQHGRVRQVAQHAGLGDQSRGSVRSLADRSRVRVLLRVHRVWHEPVGAEPLQEHRRRRAAGGPGSRPSPHHRPRERCDRLGGAARRGRPGEAVLPVLRRRRRRIRRTRCRKHGPTSSRADSTRGGIGLRQETFTRQKALGVIPMDAEFTPRPAELPSVGFVHTRPAEAPGPPDGGLCRLPRAHGRRGRQVARRRPCTRTRERHGGGVHRGRQRTNARRRP